MALKITDQNFAEYSKGELPFVVDFWATWCGPCRMVAPLIDELASEYEGKVNIGKCDVDENSEIPGQFGVRTIPTIVFMKGGEVVKKLVGAQTKEALKKEIDALL